MPSYKSQLRGAKMTCLNIDVINVFNGSLIHLLCIEHGRKSKSRLSRIKKINIAKEERLCMSSFRDAAIVFLMSHPSSPLLHCIKEAKHCI